MKQTIVGRFGWLLVRGLLSTLEGFLFLVAEAMDAAGRDRTRSTLGPGEVRTVHGIEPVSFDSEGRRVGAISRAPDVDCF